ncbi:MAG: pyridoxal kinase [Alphaproteobacteria bacterium]|nr:pyridoxal kinase [Alphaproteobacteria bacterium]
MGKIVLSIQSAVAYGHVGNAAAQPALQRLGCEVWRIDTVAFSNHPGHGGFKGRVAPATEVAELVAGLDGLGVLGRIDAVLSGYLGAAETGPAVAAAVDRVGRLRPAALYLLDPVIGEHGRVFVRPGVAEAIRDELVGRADIVTPNPFELGWLTGAKIADEAAAHMAARTLQKRLRAEGPALVIVTGIPQGRGHLVTLAVGRDDTWRASTPYLARSFNGTGDLLAALILGWLLRDRSIDLALGRALAGLQAVLQATHAADADELRLVDTLDRLADPALVWPVKRIARG